jgi:hypothetical protein
MADKVSKKFEDWKESWDWLQVGETGKVKCVVLASDKCPTCNNFYDTVLSKLEKAYDWFEIKLVDSLGGDLPYPPANAPTCYFTYNFTHEDVPNPDIRVGAGPGDMVERDINMMLMMNEYQKPPKEIIEMQADWTEHNKYLIRTLEHKEMLK